MLYTGLTSENPLINRYGLEGFVFKIRSIVFWFIILFAPLVQAKKFTHTDLESLLDKNPKTKKPVQSIAELIPLLPKEFRQNYTFVFDSRSPFKESITPKFPRTILFSKDTRLVLTYTGDPKAPGYDILEYMYFEDNTAIFKMGVRDLNINKKSKLNRFIASLFKAEKSKTLDTHSCTQCHGTDPRPINDSYPLWPGFYGSIRDTFPNDLAATRLEFKNYKKFLKHEAKHGVYKDLVYDFSGSSVPPYVDPHNFKREEAVGELDNFKYLPNTRFGMALTELNRMRILRKFLESPHFLKKEKMLLAELLDCGKSKISKNDIKKMKEFIQEENAQRLVRLGVTDQDPVVYDNDMQELKFARGLAQVDWVAQQINVSRADWSMALEPNSLSYFDGILSGMLKDKNYYIKEDIIYGILRHLASIDEKFKPYYQTTESYAEYGYPFGERINLTEAVKACSIL